MSTSQFLNRAADIGLGTTIGGDQLKPLHILDRIVQRMMFALQVGRERRQLAALDPRMLKDIGLSESTAWRESERSLFDLPRQRSSLHHYDLNRDGN